MSAEKSRPLCKGTGEAITKSRVNMRSVDAEAPAIFGSRKYVEDSQTFSIYAAWCCLSCAMVTWFRGTPA